MVDTVLRVLMTSQPAHIAYRYLSLPQMVVTIPAAIVTEAIEASRALLEVFSTINLLNLVLN
jgi:hypothetical protein